MLYLKLTYQCIKCGESFESKSYLANIQCDHCGYEYMAVPQYYDSDLKMLPGVVTQHSVEAQWPST